MRIRWQRRAWKQIRRWRGAAAGLRVQMERPGGTLEAGLLEVLRDPGMSRWGRAAAGKLLALDGGARAVEPLIRALRDENPHRRTEAARALGWIWQPGRAAARALAECLLDRAQLLETREEAAESLSYVGTRETVEAMIAVLADPDPRVRFWTVFGLGGSCRKDERATRALERMWGDTELMPGWWSVGQEALGLLSPLGVATGCRVRRRCGEYGRCGGIRARSAMGGLLWQLMA